MLRIFYEKEVEGAERDNFGRWYRESDALFRWYELPEAVKEEAISFELDEDVDKPEEVGMVGEHELGAAWGIHTGKRIFVRSRDYADAWELYCAMLAGRPHCKVGECHTTATRRRR